MKCLECNKELKVITTPHLKLCCGLTLKEYKEKYDALQANYSTLQQTNQLLEKNLQEAQAKLGIKPSPLTTPEGTTPKPSSAVEPTTPVGATDTPSTNTAAVSGVTNAQPPAPTAIPQP